jgi:hypothetical protein
VRRLPRSPRTRLVCPFWWYGRLCPANRIRPGRARRIMRDTRRMVGFCTERQWADANPRRCRCSFHSSGSRVSPIRRRAVSSGGCLPLRICVIAMGRIIEPQRAWQREKPLFGKDRYQARFCPRKPQAPGASRTIVATLDDDCERGGRTTSARSRRIAQPRSGQSAADSRPVC